MSAEQHSRIRPWHAAVVAMSLTGLFIGTYVMGGPISDSLDSTKKVIQTIPDPTLTTGMISSKVDGITYCAEFEWSKALPEIVAVHNCGEAEFFVSTASVTDSLLPPGQFSTIHNVDDTRDGQVQIKAHAGDHTSVLEFDPMSGE